MASGITPFVRVPSYEPEFVSRYLDAGAMGFLVKPFRASGVLEAIKQDEGLNL